MRRCIASALAVALLSGSILVAAEPEMPAPQKEHEWLKRFEGTWETNVKIKPPGQPEFEAKGTEIVSMLGGFWIIGKGQSDDKSHQHVMTLGYNSDKGKYVGTWVDSMTGHLWQYEGTVDKSGNILTLETSGPCPLQPGKLVKFKEVTEFKSDDHRVFSSSMLDENGKWVTMLVGNYYRKK